MTKIHFADVFILFVTNCGVSLHLWSITPRWEKEIIVTQILPFFVIRSNSYTRILNRSSLLFGSWLLRSWKGFDMISPGNQQELYPVGWLAWLGILHSNCVCTTYYFIQYEVCLSSTNIDYFFLSSLCKQCCLLRIHLPVKDRYWQKLCTSASVLNDHWAGIQPARILSYSLCWADVICCLRLELRHNLHNTAMT